jgi:hypothetical protein
MLLYHTSMCTYSRTGLYNFVRAAGTGTPGPTPIPDQWHRDRRRRKPDKLLRLRVRTAATVNRRYY